MSLAKFDWGELSQVVVTTVFFGWLFWAFVRRKHHKRGIRDSRKDEPYRRYTTAHDLTLRARDVPRTLATDEYLVAKGWVLQDQAIWQRKANTAREISHSFSASLAGDIPEMFRDIKADDWAICLLIDHSGSMRDDPIIYTAATARGVSDALVAAGTKVAVLGFSTVGWKGGRARQDWLWQEQPRRPGRLCALLHIEYQTFGETLSEQDWEVMTHPDLLRENVDGEALEWAVSVIADRPEPHKLIVILSDGAPVDDATLTHNGPSLLERHLLSVIGRVEAEGKIMLAGLGIGFAVDRYYSRSRSTADLTEMPHALIDVIGDAAKDVRQGRHEL